MQIDKDVNEDIQLIKKLLKEKLGVNYALPKYSFREGYKVHLMFDKEDLKEKYPNLNINESYSIHVVNSDENSRYDFYSLMQKNSGDKKESSPDEEETVTPKEDIYHIMTDMMRDEVDDDFHEDSKASSNLPAVVPPKTLKELLPVLYEYPEPSSPSSDVLVVTGSQSLHTTPAALHDGFCAYLERSVAARHPNILPLRCIVESDHQTFAVADYYPYTLATQLRYNQHLLRPDGSNVIVQQFLAYQLIRVLAFLHSHGLSFPSLSPDAIILTDSLWLFLPTPSIPARPLGPPSLDLLTASWVHGRLSNFEYVMALNEAAGRRMDDSTFHSIMPWVCDFTSATGGWRDFSISKFRMNKGDDQLDVTYQHSVPKHHISESLSELTYAIYMARCMPISLLRTVVRSNFQAREYPGKWVSWMCVT